VRVQDQVALHGGNGAESGSSGHRETQETQEAQRRRDTESRAVAASEPATMAGVSPSPAASASRTDAAECAPPSKWTCRRQLMQSSSSSEQAEPL
jgi:hypothetical protein